MSKKKGARWLSAMLAILLLISVAVPAYAAEACDHVWENNGDCTATCTEAGYQPQTCSVCGSTRQKPVSATGHSWENSGACTATCTEAGYQPQTCSVCGSTRQKPVSAIGQHSWVDSGASTATCTESGYQPQTCSVCGSTRQKPVSATNNHTPAEAVKENEVAATATKAGSYDSVVYCSVCGTEISRETVAVPATGSSGSSKPSTTTYTVAAPAAENGTVTVSPQSAAKGRTVTITVTPVEGYELDDLTVTDSEGNTIPLTDKGDGKFTFTMPDSKVTVSAAFAQQASDPAADPVKDCVKDGTCPAAKYTDVDLSAWYHDGIHYCLEAGLMKGTGADTFAPASTTSRAMLVTVLYRLEGEPNAGENVFTDVADGQWYTNAIAWAAETGIVGGYGDGRFGPEDSITREQFAAILYRYAAYKGYDVTAAAELNAFADNAKVSSWAETSLSWAVAEELINGMGDGTLNPQGDAVRAQMATILYRFCENIVK